MLRLNKKTAILLIGVFFLAWIGIKYLFPLLLPFLLGGLLALASEPIVRIFSKKIPRGGAAAVGVSLTILLLASLLLLGMALLVKEAALLAKILPDLGQTALAGMDALKGFLLDLTRRTPEGIRPALDQTVTGLFSGGSAIVDQLVQRLPSLASAILGWIPGSALSLGTGILATYMVSARLPGLRKWVKSGPVARQLEKIIPMLRQLRSAIGGWLKAQLKLAGVCFLIVGTGLTVLGIPLGLLWAVLIALVDAIPVLGTGTVLVPWGVICLLQGQTVKALGLAGVYVAALISRSVLEPKLIGKQLGLDPLLTLAALYTGFRIWGIGGMLLSPVICVAALELAQNNNR